jgi:excinuclease UvrABC nuclease subunit
VRIVVSAMRHYNRARKGHRGPVPAWVPADLPAAPGVYEFQAEGGTALYVGKSVNLKRRIRGWFYGGGPRDERLAEMLALARRVVVARTGSDLEARLVEAERIVAGRPRYNRALKNRARGWYLEIDRADPFPRPRTVRAPRKARARYFGPFAGRRLPDEVARLLERIFGLRSCAGRIIPDRAGSPCLAYGIGLCPAPCIGHESLDGYRDRVARAERLLADPAYGVELRARWTRLRDGASAALEFEKAARLQRRLDDLDELETRRGAFDPGLTDRSWLIALPHARPGRAVLFAMVRGRVLPRLAIGGDDPDWRRRAADAVYAARVAGLRLRQTFEPAEMVASLIVTGWLLDGSPGGLILDLDGRDERAIVSELADRVRGLTPARGAVSAG